MLPSLSEALGNRGRHPARPPWSAQQQSRHVPRAAETAWGVLELQVPGQVFPPKWEPGSRSADGDPGRASAQLLPQHKLILVTALIL